MSNNPRSAYFPFWRAWLLLAVAMGLVFAPVVSGARISPFFEGNSPAAVSRYDAGLHIYLYANADPVGRFDPSGRYSIVSVQAGTTISVGLSIALHAIAFNSLIGGDTGELGARVALQQFAESNQSQPLSSAAYQDLKRRVEKKDRRVYLHYGNSSNVESLLGGLRAPSWGTDEVYFSGWAAKLRLALPHVEPPDAAYLVLPKKGFEPVGPTPVQQAVDRANRIMPGGGREYVFEKGSGGPLTVFGPIPISVGTIPQLP